MIQYILLIFQELAVQSIADFRKYVKILEEDSKGSHRPGFILNLKVPHPKLIIRDIFHKSSECVCKKKQKKQTNKQKSSQGVCKKKKNKQTSNLSRCLQTKSASLPPSPTWKRALWRWRQNSISIAMIGVHNDQFYINDRCTQLYISMIYQ